MSTTVRGGPRRAAETISGSRNPSLHHYRDPAALLHAARREARIARGQRDFVWKGRVLPVGVPVGIVVGALAWWTGEDEDEIAPSLTRFALGFTTAVGASWLGAKLEWRLRVQRWNDPRID